MKNNSQKTVIEFTAAQWDELVALFADEQTERHLAGVRSMIAAGLPPHAVTGFTDSPVNLAEVAALHNSKDVVFYLQNAYPELVNGSAQILSAMLADEGAFAQLVAEGFRLAEVIKAYPKLMDDVCGTPALSSSTLATLVEHGLQLDAPAQIRDSAMLPLNWLGRTHSVRLMEMFLAAGADPFATNEKGRHFLHEAVTEMSAKRVESDDDERSCKGLKQMLDIAMARGVSVDIQDSDGNSPLHLAAKMGYMNKTILLIEHGASTNLANKKGKTPGQLAKAAKRSTAAQAIAASNARDSIMRVVFSNIGNRP